MSENVKEAIKEGLRVVVLAIIPMVIDSLMQSSIDYRLIIVTGIVAGLRFADSYLHDSGTMKKGLTQF